MDMYDVYKDPCCCCECDCFEDEDDDCDGLCDE